MASFIKLGVPGDFRMVNLDHVVEVRQWDRYDEGNFHGVVLVTTALKPRETVGEGFEVSRVSEPHEIRLTQEESEQFLAHVISLDATKGGLG